MSDLKRMYSNIVPDLFPDSVSVDFGADRLTYSRCSWDIGGEKKGLRYGENPDQPAALYRMTGGGLTIGGVTYRGPDQALISAVAEEHMIQAGKHPGKTNFTDADNGVAILQYLHERPAALILKHNNPCGAAWTNDGVSAALERAFWSDRIAAFGGAVVVNSPLDKAAAELIDSAYFEVVAAPDFEEGVVDILKKRKNLRIFRLPGLGRLKEFAGMPFLDIKSLSDGGLVIQQSFLNRIRSVDDFIPATAEKDGAFASARKPDRREAEDLLFAWAIESGVTSNSIIFAKDGMTTGIGTGEQDRVGCVELTIHKAKNKYADVLAFRETGLSLYELGRKANEDPGSRDLLSDITQRAVKGGLEGSVMVSDGFFPFRDGVDAAIPYGITAIAQPGGSLRDIEVIEAVNQATPQVAMVFTAQRSFKH